MLIRSRAAVDVVNDVGCTPLHTYAYIHTYLHAYVYMHTYIQVRMLIRSRAAVDVVNDVGSTPLHACAASPIGNMHICMYVCVCMHACAANPIDNMHMCMYVCTHICMHVRSVFLFFMGLEAHPCICSTPHR